MDEESEKFSNKQSSASGWCLGFAKYFANFSLALLIKVLKKKKEKSEKACNWKMYEICSKLTRKTQEKSHWRHSGVFIVNFEHISDLFLVFLLLALNR